MFTQFPLLKKQIESMGKKYRDHFTVECAQAAEQVKGQLSVAVKLTPVGSPESVVLNARLFMKDLTTVKLLNTENGAFKLYPFITPTGIGTVYKDVLLNLSDVQIFYVSEQDGWLLSSSTAQILDGTTWSGDAVKIADPLTDHDLVEVLKEFNTSGILPGDGDDIDDYEDESEDSDGEGS